MRSLSHARTFASAADLAACRVSLRGGSRTFFAASLVLPGSVRRAATGLYAFCRMADDAIDQGVDRHAAVQDLRDRLDRIYSGVPDPIAADRAFADVAFRYHIPKALPQALLEGFEWDAMNRRYETLAQLKEYAMRVAGVVGAMMAMIMGIRDAELLERACDLGVAMQLTNIARDVGEDARGGRVYLPLQWLREVDIDAHTWAASPEFSEGLGRVVRRLLAEAERLYVRSESGLAGLPAACRPGMYAARLLYAEIGHELTRRRLDSVNHRAVVSLRRKARLLAGAAVAATTRSTSSPSAAWPDCDVLSASGFLDREVFVQETAVPIPGANRRQGIGARVVWVVDLFDRLERLDRHAGAVRASEMS